MKVKWTFINRLNGSSAMVCDDDSRVNIFKIFFYSVFSWSRMFFCCFGMWTDIVLRMAISTSISFVMDFVQLYFRGLKFTSHMFSSKHNYYLLIYVICPCPWKNKVSLAVNNIYIPSIFTWFCF